MKKILYVLFLISAIVSSCSKDEDSQGDQTKSSQPYEHKQTADTNHKQDKPTTTENKTDKPSFNDFSKPEKTISPVEAGEYQGKVVTVKGFVADVTKLEKVAYLNFVKRYPENPFTAVIFADKFSDFGNIEMFENKTVEVTGRVSQYKGKPQIILNSPNQIKTIR